jgi:hypothetical protein
MNGEAGADLLIGGAAGQLKAAHGGDGRHRLPTKAEGGDVVEVVFSAQLGRAVALDTHEHVLAVHAPAIVGDPDQGAAAGL